MQLSLLLALAALVGALPQQQPMACVPSSTLSRDTCFQICDDFVSFGDAPEEVSITVFVQVLMHIIADFKLAARIAFSDMQLMCTLCLNLLVFAIFPLTAHVTTTILVQHKCASIHLLTTQTVSQTACCMTKPQCHQPHRCRSHKHIPYDTPAITTNTVPAMPLRIRS